MEVPVRGDWLDVEFLPSVRPVAVAEQAKILEHVEGAVDSRRNGRRVKLATSLDQLGTGYVSVRFRQDIDQRATLGRPAQSTGAQPFPDRRPVRRSRNFV